MKVIIASSEEKKIGKNYFRIKSVSLVEVAFSIKNSTWKEKNSQEKKLM